MKNIVIFFFLIFSSVLNAQITSNPKVSNSGFLKIVNVKIGEENTQIRIRILKSNLDLFFPDDSYLNFETRDSFYNASIISVERKRGKKIIELNESQKYNYGDEFILTFEPLPSNINTFNLNLTNCNIYGYRCEPINFYFIENYNSKSVETLSKKYYSKSNNNLDTKNYFDSISLDLTSEQSVRDYLDKNSEYIEGIWEYTAENSYRLAIIKKGFRYNAYVLEKSGIFKQGEFKASFEPAATNEITTINWLLANKSNFKTVGTVKNDVLITFLIQGGERAIYKVYPKLNQEISNLKKKPGEWTGNGSGIIISESGYIVTNYHVIEDSDEIEVEFILNEEVQKFNAEIVQVDKVNDLAIIKIFDMNFDGVDDLPYNFKTRSSDVGTKVYAYGYPMALTIMGKEIKITDGIISSKSGFEGDITTYQITAPIQGGNSGGPLFDEKGNLLGINSSGINKEIADNVGYTIKSNYVLNLIDVLPKSIELPSSTKLESLPLTEQIKEISKYVVLVKVK
tara:strand:+ start:144 stop:1676 length:1533 start_codon:yes stop_codon:yes gene_type:complete